MGTVIDYSAVRSIPPKTQGNRGFMPSQKVPGGIVEYESQIERDLFILLEHAPDVRIFQHQPKVIVYKDTKGKTKNYTPDVYFELSDGARFLIEVKEYEDYHKNFSRNEYKWQEAENWAKEHGIKFKVLTDVDIRTERLANLWFLLGSSKVQQNSNLMTKLVSSLPSDGISYNRISQEFGELTGLELTKAAQVVCYAIYHGYVFVDTFSTEVLNERTTIRKKLKQYNDPFQPIWMEIDLNGTSFMLEKIETDLDLIGIDLSASYLSKKKKEKAEKRELIVKEWLKQPPIKRTEQWRAEFSKKHFVSKSTIYRWVTEYEKFGIEGLVKQLKSRGRKSPYDRKALALLEAARKFYLKPENTFKRAYVKLNEIWDHESISVPSKPMLEKYVYQNTSNSELSYHKRGRRFHKSVFTPALASFQGAILPMQVLQFDNTNFDVFPVDSENRLGLSTPNITAAIDCYTRMITGFYLSLKPSSSQSVLETLVQSILNKRTYTDMFDTEHEWPIEGFPVLLLVDNGMDYRAHSVRDFCMKYNIILEFAPIRTPRYKAYIEQWFRIVNHALVDEGVGGVRPLLKKRLENPDLKPENDASLTISEIETWLGKWIVDNYHLTNPYEDRVPAPFLRWEDVKNGDTNMILPAARDAPTEEWEHNQLYINTLMRFERSLANYGVRWNHLNYNSKELAKVFGRLGSGQKVTLLLDRRDIRRAWVEDPISEKPIEVYLASGWAATLLETVGDKPISISFWESTLKKMKENNVARISAYTFKMTYSSEKRKDLLRKGKKETKRKRKEKEISKETEQRNRRKPVRRQKLAKQLQEFEEEIDDNEEIVAFETEIDEVRDSVLTHSKREENTK